MSVAYGIQIQQENDPYLTLAEGANQGAVIAAVPGRFLVDAIPLLKYVPDWFPGASFKRKAREWYKLTRMMAAVPYADAKKRIVCVIGFLERLSHLLSLICRNLVILPTRFY